MTDESSSIRPHFEKEVDRISQEPIMSPAFRRRRFITWMFRTTITILAVIYFWEHKWVRWAFYIYIPLSLLSLASIYFWPRFIKRKIAKTERTISEADRTIAEAGED